LNDNGPYDGFFEDDGKDMFKHLPSLTYLDLSEFGFSDLPPGVFAVPSLKKLFLNGNRLMKIPQEIKTLAHLEELHMSDNFNYYTEQGIKLDADSFRGLTKLQAL
jgi:Leucine-rich repeat (LRR) protein